MKSKFNYFFVFVFVFAVTFFVLSIVNEKIITPFNAIVETTAVITDYDKSDYRYRVSVFNGKLAVFDGKSKIPYKVYDTYINSLPEEDIYRLSQGIFVNSSSELMKIIEEYTS